MGFGRKRGHFCVYLCISLTFLKSERKIALETKTNWKMKINNPLTTVKKFAAFRFKLHIRKMQDPQMNWLITLSGSPHKWFYGSSDQNGSPGWLCFIWNDIAVFSDLIYKDKNTSNESRKYFLKVHKHEQNCRREEQSSQMYCANEIYSGIYHTGGNKTH